ncbi:MAG: hypothetical protein II567_16635 [Candidatus Riflebacteria bacterium]|nr:hypothetical protein [Candidatus Riflebacteria bacterium]
MALESFYEELTKIYNNLRKANEELLINNSDQDGLIALVDKRSAYFDEIYVLRDELAMELSRMKSPIDYDSMEIIELIRELPNHYPELISYRNQVIEALQKLVESEKNVSENMSTMRDDIKQELNHARTGKKTLNAYKPVTGYAGSHFIDSKK